MKNFKRVLFAAVLATPFAFALSVAQAVPTGMEWTEKKNDGTIDGDTLYTTLKKKLTIDVLGTLKGSELSVQIMGGQILGAGKGKEGTTSVKLKDIEGIADGTYSIVVIETTEMGASAPVGGATLVVDTANPLAPTELEFDDATTDVEPSSGVLTPNVPFAIEADAEANSNVYLVVNGKMKKPKLKTAGRDRAGAADNDGDFEAHFDFSKSRTYELVGGDPDKPLKLKLKEGENTIAVVAVDRAGNVSDPGPTLPFMFVSKAPKPAKKVMPVGLEVLRDGSVYQVGTARPTFRGNAEPGLMVDLLIDGVDMGWAPVDGAGVFFVTPDADIAMGAHEVTVEVINDALLASKETKPVLIDVMVGGVPLQLPEDDFGDNAIDPILWTLVEPSPGDVMAIEANKRLTFEKMPSTGEPIFAGYLSNEWALDLNSDFVLSVRFSLPQDPFAGDAALGIVFLDEADFDTGEVTNGIAIAIGTDDVDGYVSVQRTVMGVDLEEFFEYDRPNSGVGVIEYDAVSDTLFVGERRNDPEAIVFPGLRSASPSEQSSIFLVVFSEGTVPAFNGSSQWFDSFEILEGVIVNDGISPPPPVMGSSRTARTQIRPDINGDGIVSNADLERVIQALGTEGESLAEDVNGDGKVSAEDLREVLIYFGSPSNGF